MPAGLKVDNTGTGEGIVGTSLDSAGLSGSGPTGVYGSGDLRDGTGVSGYGSTGVSGSGSGPDGVGVIGAGDNAGRDSAGVAGFGPTGVFGSGAGGDGVGVFGYGPTGVSGSGTGPNGAGISGSGTDTGVAGSGGRLGVAGSGNTGVYGTGVGDINIGVLGRGRTGIYGLGGQTGVFAVGQTGVATIAGDIGVHASGNNWAIMTDGDVWTQGDLWVRGDTIHLGNVAVWGDFAVAFGGSKSVVVKLRNGEHRALYCMESPENWFEDFGRVRLVRGKARVRLDRIFAQVVRTGDYHVFLSPEGLSHGLYVSRRTRDGFEVREQHQGKSTVPFSYRIVARRRDVDAPRFKRMKLPAAPKRPRPAKLRAPKIAAGSPRPVKPRKPIRPPRLTAPLSRARRRGRLSR
jgi:hypothetical protein